MARGGYAQELSLIIERGIALAQRQIGILEKQAEDFKEDIPRGWTSDFQSMTKALSDLSMSHARYIKAQDQWLDRMTPEERLEATKSAIIETLFTLFALR